MTRPSSPTRRTPRAGLRFGMLVLGPLLLCACQPSADHDHDHGSADGSHAEHEHDDHDHAHEAGEEHYEDHAHEEGHDDHDDDPDHDHGPEVVEIPEAVRRHLGLTFARAQRRSIADTRRFPGHFEAEPNARHAYGAPVSGQVELRVAPFDEVAIGAPLFRIHSPDWREHQGQLSAARADIERLQAELDSAATLEAAHREHTESLKTSIVLWKARADQLEQLSQAGGGSTEQRNAALAAQLERQAELASLREEEARLEVRRRILAVDLANAERRRSFLLESAVAATGLGLDELTADVDGRPGWARLQAITVRATEAGVVERLEVVPGSWVNQAQGVLQVLQPQRLRFRATAPQSAAAELRDGLTAEVVGPRPNETSFRGRLRLDLVGDAHSRTLDLLVSADEATSRAFPEWARAGLAGQLAVVVDGTAEPQIAVPLACVQTDGVAPVLFRRDPADPDHAERLVAVRGLDDGAWVAIEAGLREGDEVVLQGAFQLLLATASSGEGSAGGHFHADGSFHGEDH